MARGWEIDPHEDSRVQHVDADSEGHGAEAGDVTPSPLREVATFLHL